MKYTRGPWRKGKITSVVVSDEPVPEMRGSDDVEYYGGHLIAESVAEKNADRIVACVNACEGITTEALEAGLIKKMLFDLNKVLRSEGYKGIPAMECDVEEAPDEN